MFAYNEDGDIISTDSIEAAEKYHAHMVLASERYRLNSKAVGRLREILGEVDPELSEQAARLRVERALMEAGFGFMPFEVAVDGLDKQWRAKIDVG